MYLILLQNYLFDMYIHKNITKSKTKYLVIYVIKFINLITLRFMLH